MQSDMNRRELTVAKVGFARRVWESVRFENRLMTLRDENTWTAKEMIANAEKHPPQPVICELLYVGDILLLHGSEESFKSMLVLQLAEDLATRGVFLRRWPVTKNWRVGVIETEMHEAMMGERLRRMFSGSEPPENILFWKESALHEWRRVDMVQKLRSIQDWITSTKIEILIIDTANDFFRGQDNPSEERSVGKFFDELRSLKVDAKVIVRHDRKKKPDSDDLVNSNERIRGSAEWKEDPEVILSVERKDRRTNEIVFEVGKLRYGRKPDDDIVLWFDRSTFRLTPLPPVIALLEKATKSRQELIEQCEARFGLSERFTDAAINEEKPYLLEEQVGHNKRFGLNPKHVGSWARYFQKAVEAKEG